MQRFIPVRALWCLMPRSGLLSQKSLHWFHKAVTITGQAYPYCKDEDTVTQRMSRCVPGHRQERSSGRSPPRSPRPSEPEGDRLMVKREDQSTLVADTRAVVDGDKFTRSPLLCLVRGLIEKKTREQESRHLTTRARKLTRSRQLARSRPGGVAPWCVGPCWRPPSGSG